MTRVVRDKAAGGGAVRVRAVTAAAEDVEVAAGSVELVVVGNAFHRLRREAVARRVLEWLEPGGHLALCWSTSPWAGALEWQRDLWGLLLRWQEELGVVGRVPSGAGERRAADPDREVLARAGFGSVERYVFAVEHRWTVDELAGHVRSTSFLPPAVLGDRGPAFDAELRDVLGPHAVGGRLVETVSFAYDLARERSSATGS